MQRGGRGKDSAPATSQQLIQAEVAINRQYSVVVARDESEGVLDGL
jgi:hypothetical protein